jgi:ABC-type cobalamin transport system permease subunit
MLYRKPITIVIGAALAAYNAGEQFRFYDPSPAPILLTASSTGSVSIIGSALIFDTTSFAKIDPPPPVVLATQKFEQT